jgi:hypothetical protein
MTIQDALERLQTSQILRLRDIMVVVTQLLLHIAMKRQCECKLIETDIRKCITCEISPKKINDNDANNQIHHEQN